MANYSAKFSKAGNIKVGDMWVFNKLAGSGEICGCKGTCGEHCKGCYNAENPGKSPCYVFRRYVQYTFDIDKNAVIRSHIKNTEAMRESVISTFLDLEEQIKRAKRKPSAIRIHASGEIEETEELFAWFDLAKKFENIKFYIYTKNFEVLDEVLNVIENGERILPSNFFINISVWHESGIKEYKKWEHIENVRAFIYDDKTFDYEKEGIKINCHCPAYDEKGKMNHNITCDKCQICFQKKAKVCACYDH